MCMFKIILTAIGFVLFIAATTLQAQSQNLRDLKISALKPVPLVIPPSPDSTLIVVRSTIDDLILESNMGERVQKKGGGVWHLHLYPGTQKISFNVPGVYKQETREYRALAKNRSYEVQVSSKDTFPWVFFDLYYQLLGFFSTFWKQQFGETPVENYHEGVGGTFGIGNPIFRLGAGSHNMLHRNWVNKAPQFSGAGYQIHALLGIPYKRLFRIEFGLGYYWIDYKLTDRANKIISLKNNGAFFIITPSLGTPNVKFFGEGNLAIKPSGTLPFLYFRMGLRFAYPIKSDLKS